MQRSSSVMRCKLRVAVYEGSFSPKGSNNFQSFNIVDSVPTHQFLIFATLYETVRDIRRTILATFAKLYPLDALPTIAFLKDSMGYDLDDDFLVGELFESNDMVIAVSQCSSGLLTPESCQTSPVAAQIITKEIVCPTPKMPRRDPEEFLSKVQVSNTCSSSSSDGEEVELRPQEKFATVDEKIASVLAAESSGSEADSESGSEESSSESESEEEEQSLEEEESELEVPAASSTDESEESSEEDESETEPLKPTVVIPPVEESSSEEEESSSEEEAEAAPQNTPAAVSSSGESSGEEDSEAETESGSDSESVEEKPAVIKEESSSSSESEISDESTDELVLPPTAQNDVKQVLKGVPKFTSLTSLNECLSQAVSGRATPLQASSQGDKAQSQPTATTKGRVRLPRKKPGTTTGYDASLFA